MNIFVLSETAYLAALWLDDVRKNKMILESCQLLSAAVRLNDPTTTMPVYRLTHKGHPCAVWASASRRNFYWLLEYTWWLIQQRHKVHACQRLVPLFEQYFFDGAFPAEEKTPFANCAAHSKKGISFKHLPIEEAYRSYINQRWLTDTITLTWKDGEKPDWSSV